MRPFVTLAAAALLGAQFMMGVVGAPALAPETQDALPPSGCEVASLPGCHHIHVKSQTPLFVFTDATAEVAVNFPIVPVSGHVVKVFPGDFVVWHDHTGVGHTATAGLTAEQEDLANLVLGPGGTLSAGSVGGTSLDLFDVTIGASSRDHFQFPNLPSTGTYAIPYYCNVFPHTALGMHAVIVFTDNVA